MVFLETVAEDGESFVTLFHLLPIAVLGLP